MSGMGLTERHWFENEDVPENYEWALEDDVYNSRTNKKPDSVLKEQEAKKGQWIPIESPTGIEAFGVKEMTVMDVRCSVCGSEEDVSFTGYKYCPRCGAKME